ncbi:MAG: AGE family epimerase/isomerase [Lachnospiraceae bacterium]|nr:AGE family epimerase/isomerase [Lachnospiraceae bacterium]
MKYTINTEENKLYLKELARELLAFAVRFPSPGGSAYYLHDDGSPWVEKPLDNYETCRMVHSYCIGSFLGFAGGRELAEAGLKSLNGEMQDKVHGGWFTGISPDGTGAPDKLCYAHAFVILAASSAMLADLKGAGELFDRAVEIFDKYFWSEGEGLCRDTWNDDFTILDSYRGLNSNMHTVEAFLAAADVTGQEKYRVRAGRIICHVVKWAEENAWRLPEHYTGDWVPDLERNREKPDDQFKPYGATPGHGIEWARLITQWALSTYPGKPEKYGKYVEAAENLFMRAVKDGWNVDGARGIVYTTDWNGTPVVHDRMQWTLAEGINTAAVLCRVTGRAEYAGYYHDFLQYLEEKVRDHRYGSWYHQLDRHNQKLETVWPGKPDIYHALQSTLIPYCDPAVSVAVAVRGMRTASCSMMLGQKS